jgi:pSer/pThr/pTyr-binding forkhead associated (FHA) protein
MRAGFTEEIRMLPLIPALAALLIAILAIVYFVVLKRDSSGPARPGPGLSIEDEEGTQVKIVGHRLVRLQGGVKVGNEFPITGSLSIGSAPNCTFVVPDASISPIHANVRLEIGKAVVEDAGSVGGTYVNEDRLSNLTPRTLKDGDVIKVGSTTILYKSGN